MKGYLAVIDILRLDGPVGLLVGGSGVGIARVFPGDAPQGQVFPLITVDATDGEPFDTKSGVSVLDNDQVKVMCYATTDTSAYDLATKVRTALDGQTGTHNGLYVEGLRWLRQSSYDENYTNKRVRVHEQDYEVRIRI
jgi:hypothetical protein